MEKNFSKEMLISYLQAEDQEINQAAFGYVIRDIIKHTSPLFQMPEIVQYSSKISFGRKEEILLAISSKLEESSEILRFIELSYEYPNQLLLICRFLDKNIDSNTEANLLKIIKEEKNISKIPDICYQILLKKALLGNTEYQKVLETLLDKNTNYLMTDLIGIIQEEKKLNALVLLGRLIQKNSNGNNLYSLLRCIEKYIREDEKDIASKILLQIVTQYAASPEMNRQAVDLILALISCQNKQKNVKNVVQKEILKTLIINIKETHFLAMEDIILAFSRFVKEQHTYSFALSLLKETILEKKFKRANILWLTEFIVCTESNGALLDEFLFLLKRFITQMGAYFDKSDMEHLKKVFNLCQKKSYLSELLDEILKKCQKTSFQIEMLLIYAETYPTYRPKILTTIDWLTCPVSSAIPYKLQFFFEEEKDNEIYLNIFEKLVSRKTDNSYLYQQYGKMLSEFNLSEEKIKKYKGIAKQIKNYQERQNLLLLLNS